MNEFRKHSVTEIEYVLVTEPDETISLFLSPAEFDNYAIDFIKACPKDVLQLHDGVKFFYSTHLLQIHRPYNFSVVYGDNAKSFLSKFYSHPQCRVFFIDATCVRINEVIEILEKLHISTHFYCIFADKDNRYVGKLKNMVNNPGALVHSLWVNQNEIGKTLGIEILSLFPSVPLWGKELSKWLNFLPTRNNTFTTLGALGNFLIEQNAPLEKAELSEEVKNASKKAHENSKSFDRQNLFYEQVQQLDYLTMTGYEENLITRVSPADPLYVSLIVVAPFHNPDMQRLYQLPDTKEMKIWLTQLQTEQSSNYINETKVKQKPEEAFEAISMAQKKASFLDDISFLHASFMFSPVIRLPFSGRTIYRELSFFRTSAFANLTNAKNRRSLEATIKKFSLIYSKNYVGRKLQELLEHRNGQLVLITDLPLEWLEVKGVPLAFTHDVCRIPILIYRGVMSLFAKNNWFTFTIPANILKKTLVIFGTNEPAFSVWHKPCIELGKIEGFHTQYCNNIAEVKQAIESYAPDFVVFDCHGTYDQPTNTTTLWIGEEQLTNNIIVEQRIVAPIIFLSACGTAPTYDPVNTIANAFFEAGCLSVTTTYLPVEITNASVLYLRLLKNLGSAVKNPFHKNWCAFVSHTLRTSTIIERYRIAKSQNEEQRKLLTQKAILATSNSMIFEQRRNVFENIAKEIEQITGLPEKPDAIIPEYLLYSTLGRADLIYFESWLNAHKKLATS